jgi:dCMP deaminase
LSSFQPGRILRCLAVRPEGAAPGIGPIAEDPSEGAFGELRFAEHESRQGFHGDGFPRDAPFSNPGMTRPLRVRPDPDEYFMRIALAVRARADCTGNRVGALIVQDRRIVATGYNGTPENMLNCSAGGCHRCAHREQYPSGTGYDLCICVHAEQNAILAAARFGIAVEGGSMYTTMRPCFGCTKEMLQAGIREVFYLHDWVHPDPAKQAQYVQLQARFAGGLRELAIDDPDADWAVAARRLQPAGPPDETGHSVP